ncbi:MAG: 2-hydroxyacid dehydrogenase [Octadecabacter sp.]
MTKQQVMVMSTVFPSALPSLAAQFDLLRCDLAEDRDVFLRENGKNCRAVILNGHVPLGAEELQHMPNLELAACTSAGFESIDLAQLDRAGIALTNSSLALKDDVADAAVMLLLATRRNLVQCDAYVRSGQWGQDGPFPLLSTLKGKRAGILGFGTIGQEIAARLLPMKLEIGYCTRTQRDVDFSYFSDAATLAAWCDIMIVVIPGGAETHHLVGRDVMTKLGPAGTLINVARGSVVDETALIDCLTSGKLMSAGLDVFQNEPTPNSALTSLPNVVLYPHHASGTQETRGAMAQLAVDNIAAHFQGRPLLTPVMTSNQTFRTSK